MEKTVDPLIQRILKELKEEITDKYDLSEMRVFGSTARGDRRVDSDIDVFVHLHLVNRQIEEALFDVAYELEIKYDCLIDLIVFSDEALKGKHAGTPIYEKVLSEGTVI